MTTIESSIRIPQDILFHELGGEVVILNASTGKYFGLDEVGTRMWSLINEHGQLEPALDALLLEYEVDEERLKEDLLQLVEQLTAHGLLEINDK